MRLVLNSSKCGKNGIIDVVLPQLDSDIESFYLLNAIIPFSFYIINSSNNVVLFNGVSYSLTSQNYNSYEIASELQALLIPTNVNVRVVFNKQKNKFMITNNGANFTIQFKGSGAVFGFLDNITYTSTFLPFSGNTYFLESSLVADNVNGLRALYLRSNLSTMSTIIENTDLGTNLLYRIPVDKPYGSVLNYMVNNSDYNIPITADLQRIRLTITDSNNKDIDFNGVPFEIVFYLKLRGNREIIPRTVEVVTNKEDNPKSPYNLIDWNNLGLSA
jgi:hypothetical protein